VKANLTPLAFATALTFLLGVGLMIPFELTATRILGVACLFAAIVCGVALVASPGFLGEEEPPDA